MASLNCARVGPDAWRSIIALFVALAAASACQNANFSNRETGGRTAESPPPSTESNLDAGVGVRGGTSSPASPDDDDQVGSKTGADAGDAAHIAAPPTRSLQRWPEYGFDLHNTQANPQESVLNAGNVAQLSERWRVTLPFGATSTPVVYGGSVYFGGWDGNAYAVNGETGEIRWQRQVTSMLVRSTPVVTEDRIYLAAGPKLVALKRTDGTMVFETLLDAHPETLLDGSPKVVDGLVIVGVSSVENSLSKAYTFTGSVVAIDADTGQEVWRVKTTGDDDGPCPGAAGAAVWSTPAIDQELGLVYVGVGQNYTEPVSPCSDSLLAIHYRRDHEGERLAWKVQYTPGDIWAREPLTSLVLGDDADVTTAILFEIAGQPVVGASDKKGRYRVFERATGKLVWQRELDSGAFTALFPPSAFHDGVLYAASNHMDTSFLIADANTPKTSTLYALDAATGESRWEVKVPMIQIGASAIANGLLYHATMDGVLYARDLATGEVAWSTTVDGQLLVSPSIVNGHVYVSTTLFGQDGQGQTTAIPGQGGVVSSFGLGRGPSKEWAADVQAPKSFTQDECQTAVLNVSDWPSGGKPSADCASCLCECNSNAAAQCDTCWLQAPCVVLFCASSGPDEMRGCVGNSCQFKLITNYTFERSVEVAPCAIDCAQTCGFF